MYNKIAVLLNEKDQLTSLELSCKTLLYQQTANGWQLNQEIIWRLGAETGIAEIRNDIQVLIGHLEDCRIIVSKKLTGIPYHILDKSGFHIFETDGAASQNLFCDIIREMKEISEKARVSGTVAQVPVSPNHDGIYYFNLIELQQTFPEITSKQALKRFMEDTVFIRLELICNHMPPWMDTVLILKNYVWQIEKIEEHRCKVIISVNQGAKGT